MYRLADDNKDKDPSNMNFQFSIYYANQLKKDKSIQFFNQRVPKQIRKYAKKCKRATSNFLSSLYKADEKRFHIFGSASLLNNLDNGLRFFKSKSCICDAILVSECKKDGEIIVNGFCSFQIVKKKKKGSKHEIRISIIGHDKKFANVVEEILNFFKESMMFDATKIPEDEDSDSDSDSDDEDEEDTDDDDTDDDEDDDDDDGSDLSDTDKSDKSIQSINPSIKSSLSPSTEDKSLTTSLSPSLDFEDLGNYDAETKSETKSIKPSETKSSSIKSSEKSNEENNIEDLTEDDLSEKDFDLPDADADAIAESKDESKAESELKGGAPPKKMKVILIRFPAKFNKLLDGIMVAAHFEAKERDGEDVCYRWRLKQFETDDDEEHTIVRGKKIQYKYLYEIDEENEDEDEYEEDEDDKIQIIAYITMDNKFVQLTKQQIENGYYLKSAKQKSINDVENDDFEDLDLTSDDLTSDDLKSDSKEYIQSLTPDQEEEEDFEVSDSKKDGDSYEDDQSNKDGDSKKDEEAKQSEKTSTTNSSNPSTPSTTSTNSTTNSTTNSANPSTTSTTSTIPSLTPSASLTPSSTTPSSTTNVKGGKTNKQKFKKNKQLLQTRRRLANLLK